MLGPEVIATLTQQARIDKLEKQIEVLTETQKNILQHLREVVLIVTENSKESSIK